LNRGFVLHPAAYIASLAGFNDGFFRSAFDFLDVVPDIAMQHAQLFSALEIEFSLSTASRICAARAD
jgi:hypothetical protein